MPKFLEVTNKDAARRAINASFINVLDYIADPDDPATHRAGFQAAIDAAVAGEGYEIVIPAGDWYVEGLVIPKKATLKIRGHGSSAWAQRATGFVSVPPGTRLIRTGNLPVFIGIGGVPPTVTATTLTDNNVSLVGFFDLVRDVVVEDLTLENQNAAATTPLLDLRGCSALHFERVVFYSESRTAPMVELRAVMDSHFVECKIQGGGVSLRMLESDSTYWACNSDWFNSCSFEYYGISGIVIGNSAGSLPQLVRNIGFTDQKMEGWLQNSPTTPAIDLQRANGIMFNRFYLGHMNTTSAVVKCDRVTGLYGDIGFIRQFSAELDNSNYAEPSARLELGANATLVDLDVYLHSGPDSSVNVVTQANPDNNLIRVRVHGVSEKVNNTTQSSRFDRVKTRWQLSESGFCQYIFSTGNLNRWAIGNPQNIVGDQQQFSITASDPTGNAQEVLRLRSFNHTEGSNPVTATYRDLTVQGFLNLNNTKLGWVNFQNLVDPPAAPVGGLRLYASGGSLTVDGSAIILNSGRNAANGFAGLDAGGKVLAAQLPTSVMQYQGVWNATTNTPTLANGTGDTGDVYRVSVGGTRDLGAGSVTYEVGDLVIYDGAVWQRSDSTDAVTTVNGYTGTVTLTKSDVGLGNVDNTADASKNVSSAATLTTGRTIRTNLGSTSTATFDGSANVTPGVDGILAVGNGGTGVTTLTGLVKGNGTSAFSAATAGTDYSDVLIDNPHDLNSGEATLARREINAQGVSLSNGQLRLSYFTARRTEEITSIRTIVNIAAVGTTLARVGIYEVNDSNNELTLVASTANDTALFASTGLRTKSLSASFTKTRGKRYAVGLLSVGTTTAPQFSGNAFLSGAEAEFAPRQSGLLVSQTDLTTPISNASLATSGSQYYAALVP